MSTDPDTAAQPDSTQSDSALARIVPTSVPLTDTVAPDPLVDAASRFRRDVAEHRMLIWLDEHKPDAYRHLTFRQPRNEIASFEIITTPRTLTVLGDGVRPLIFRVGSEDPFDFFCQGAVNPDYWAEKIANDAARHATHGYDSDHADRVVRAKAEAYVASRLTPSLEACQSLAGRTDYVEAIDGFRSGIEWDVLDQVHDERALRQAVADFWTRPPGEESMRPFLDAHDWDLHTWDYRYVWTCHAIRHAIEQYRAAKTN